MLQMYSTWPCGATCWTDSADIVSSFAVERATKVCGDLKGLEPSPVFASIGVGRVNIDGMRSMAHAAGASAPEQYFPLHVGFS